MDEPTVEQVDVDGAIREGIQALESVPRGRMLARGAAAAGGLMGGGALLALLSGSASATTTNDLAILNFALTLEFLERDFYAQALALGGAGGGEQRRFAEIAHGHESEHVLALQGLLGSSAIAEPAFDFGDIPYNPARFRQTAIVLEDTGVKAYKGQAPLIDSDAILAAALSIHSVEANHAAWIRFISNADPTYEGAFETPLTKAQVLAAVAKTGFIVSPA